MLLLFFCLLFVLVPLRESYSDDKATGFEVGELRGVVWAEYPITATD